jgi:hypothetical protein
MDRTELGTKYKQSDYKIKRKPPLSGKLPFQYV